MNIVVCVKQVPAPWQVRFDAGAGQVILAGADAITNPFDEYGVEEALRIKEKIGGASKTTALTIGPAPAEKALRSALEVGVDEALHVKDAAFDGADVLATARALALAIKKLGAVHLVICGRQAPDGDTGQVGPTLAAILDWPQVTFVRKIESIAEGGPARVHRLTESGYDVVETTLPAVLTVVKEINEPRLPSLKGKMRAKSASITTWTAKDIGADSVASAIQVMKLSSPRGEVQGEMIAGKPEAQAAALVEKLRGLKLA